MCKLHKHPKEFHELKYTHSKWCKSCIQEFNTIIECTKGEIDCKVSKENAREVNRRLWIKNYRHNNREKMYASNLKWIRKNPNKGRMYQRNRRAKTKNCAGTITDKDWDELLKESNYKCLCCGSTQKLSLDHITPLHLGGDNTKENAQVLCHSCNSKKHTSIIDYRIMRNS